MYIIQYTLYIIYTTTPYVCIHVLCTLYYYNAESAASLNTIIFKLCILYNVYTI